MEIRQLGASDLMVSPMGLGSMAFSDYYGERPEERESIRSLQEILALGVNFFDTADIYGAGHNEEIIGRAFSRQRDQIVLATKFGFVLDAAGNLAGLNGSPEHVHRSCDLSLKRLGMEYIDLYYAHRVDPSVPVEETVGAMGQLVDAGKVRYIGLSEATAEQLRRAGAVHPITALQTEYSLWSREPEQETLDASKDMRTAFVAYSPLGRGFLAGKVPTRDSLVASDFRRTLPRFEPHALERNQVFLELIDQLAADKKATRAQIALAWLLCQRPHIVPIPGTVSPDRMRENLGALQIRFSQTELAAIEKRLPTAVGSRYQDDTF